MKKQIFTIVLLLSVHLFCLEVFALEVKLIDSKEYQRTKGKPNVYTDIFPGEVGKGKIIILNGKSNGSNRVSSAKIFINNQLLFSEKHFNQKVFRLDKKIQLKENNTIEVKLNGAPKSFLIISVYMDVKAGGGKVIGPKGGVVLVSDVNSDIFGAKIFIPPNALDKDTLISISGNLKVVPDSTQKFVFVQLEPSGTMLNVPATIEIPFDSTFVEDKALLASYIYSTAIPIKYVGSEDSRWEQLEILSVTDSRIEAKLKHFSWIVSVMDKPIYTILHLRGDYLKEADLIYALTLYRFDEEDEFNWFPGHAGLYLGTDTATNDLSINDDETIIESVPPKVRLNKLFSEFRNNWYHLYMGARQFRNNLTNEDRKKIAEYAISKEDRDYSKTGQGNDDSNNFSCAGLTEAAYDNAGKSIIQDDIEWPAILPLDQYVRTIPVSKISVKVGHIIEIPVRGVLVEEAETWAGVKYHKYKEISAYPATNLRKDLGMFFNNNHFFWQPPQAGTFLVSFESKGIFNEKEYSALQPLTVIVKEKEQLQPFYLPNGMFTNIGGGKWGPVLTLRGEISGTGGTELILVVTKNDYTPWQTAGKVYFFEGSYKDEKNRISEKNTEAGSTMSVSYTHNLSVYSDYPKKFYVKYIPEGSDGEFAWVGPIIVDKR